MVAVLTMMIIIMIIDRYIYKSRTFRQQDASEIKKNSKAKAMSMSDEKGKS